MGKKRKKKPGQWLHTFRRTSQWLATRREFLQWLVTTGIAAYAAWKSGCVQQPAPPPQLHRVASQSTIVWESVRIAPTTGQLQFGA
jgi:hypothetical protein